MTNLGIITIFVTLALSFVQASKDKVKIRMGHELRASSLRVKASNTVGTAMFEMGIDGDEDNTIRFGFAKIVELDADDTVLTDAKHGCNFAADDAGIECTENEETEGTMTGVDEEANAKEIKYSMIRRECALSSCNTNQNAKMVISNYIFQEGGYLCQPDCEADSFEQSAVFSGTAKWTIEIEDWDFCVGSCGDSKDKDAAKMKIFFTLDGKSKGRPSVPTLRKKVPFNVIKCKERVEKEKAEIKIKENKRKDNNNEKKLPDNEDENKRPDNEDENKRPDNENKNESDKLMRGRCRAALSTSFKDQPEDQDSFNFADTEGKTGSMLFRMFASATLDKNEGLSLKKTVRTGSGFEGPTVEVGMEPVGKSGKTQQVKYVTISVETFSKSLSYDPMGDMSESGGTTTESGATILRATLVVLLVSLAALLC